MKVNGDFVVPAWLEEAVKWLEIKYSVETELEKLPFDFNLPASAFTQGPIGPYGYIGATGAIGPGVTVSAGPIGSPKPDLRQVIPDEELVLIIRGSSKLEHLERIKKFVTTRQPKLTPGGRGNYIRWFETAPAFERRERLFGYYKKKCFDAVFEENHGQFTDELERFKVEKAFAKADCNNFDNNGNPLFSTFVPYKGQHELIATELIEVSEEVGASFTMKFRLPDYEEAFADDILGYIQKLNAL